MPFNQHNLSYQPSRTPIRSRALESLNQTGLDNRKVREARERVQNDLDSQRRKRIDLQTKLLRFKDQYAKKQMQVSELRYQIEDLKNHTDDCAFQNQKLKSQISRLQQVYQDKIINLQNQLKITTKQFQKMQQSSSQDYQRLQEIKAAFERQRNRLEVTVKTLEKQKKEIQFQLKKITDQLQKTKLIYQDQKRDFQNRHKRTQKQRLQSTIKSYQQKVFYLNQSVQQYMRKQLQYQKLLKQKQNKKIQMEEDVDQLKRELYFQTNKNSKLEIDYIEELASFGVLQQSY